MKRTSHRSILSCVSFFLAAGLAVAAEDSDASRIGRATPLYHQDPGQSEAHEATPIAGMADSLVGSTTGGGLMPEMPDNVEFDNPGANAQTLFDTKDRTVTMIGDPIVYMKSDNGIEVFSRKAVVNTQDKTVTMTGDLAIFQKGSLSRASKAIYYYDSKVLKTTDVKAKIDGLILRSGEFNYETDADGKVYIIGHNASVTTEDDQEPLTWIGGRKIKIYAEDSIAFTGLKTYYDGVPFFYFPFFYHSLNPREGYMPNIGSKSYWGAFLENRYGILFGNRRVEKGRPTADYLSTLHLDYRSRRGLGYGVDLENIETARIAPDMKGLSLYAVDDNDPTISPTDEARPRNMDPFRWRIALQDMWQLPIQDTLKSQWRFKANINALSDEYMLRDFFPEIYQRNPEPDNTVAFTRTDSLTSTTLLQRMPINDFYMSDQRTELSFDRIRASLFGSSIIYESQSSAAFLRQYLPPSMRFGIRDKLDHLSPNDPNRDYWQRMLMTNGYFRVHTYHELSTSYKVARFLNLTPRVGGGYTGYQDVEDVGNFNQGIFFTALDAYIKFSRKYDNVYFRPLGLNKLTHIVQPYVTIAYTGTNQIDPMIPQIDGYSPSTNPIAISPGRITEIDSMATSAVLRYGLKNFLMTERDSVSQRWFTCDMFMDSYLHNVADDRQFSNLYSTMNWYPLPWLSYGNVVQFPVLGDDKDLRYREYNNYISFMPTKSLDLMIGHRYLSQHPLLENSSQLDVQVIYRVTEELAVSGSWRWELRSGEMDIQEYNIYKNMGTWYLGMGVYVRRNGNKDEIGLGISFTMKETGDHMPLKFY